MAASSCTSTWRRPRRSTPAVKARLVSSTRPSGIIAPMPATVPRMAAVSDSFERIWLTISSAAVGTISHVTRRRIRSVPRRSSDRTSENWRASAVIWLA